ncbi:ClpA/ClpB-like protein [Tamaricihabitans halophyticus]|uniref:ClpA/ClpB-like protein n=1 Tax=Tamaricihabitans halophyticus TaxID=1262583 RepID=A0A4R2R197_9PSEU|nr:AAA family ATPase [Tamaricihabitans halophyticus]TCP55258.1 ClpA/ClpB-like protein [Tamaricihabitans halophyticus]
MPFLSDMYHEQNARRGANQTDEDPVSTTNPNGTSQLGVGSFDPVAIAARLRARIHGQETAIDAVVNALLLARAGVSEPDRPLANLLLVGPTGVGKTELVRRLAAELRSDPDDLCRVDMNALAQEHYAASFSGAPPGYAGSKEAFSVFDRTKVEGDLYRPGIVLFDEVEKAHPTVLRALLHILDSGTLRLANGQQTISFRNSLVFLTSNLGSATLAKRRSARWRRAVDKLSPALATRMSARDNRSITSAALRDFFDPEFLNRIDQTAIFADIDTGAAETIIRQEIALLAARLRRKNVELTVADSVVELLHTRGFDPVYGARALRRALRTTLATPVAECLLHERPTGTDALSLDATTEGEKVLVQRVP